MNFDARFAVVILAAFASANAMASLACVWQWRRAILPEAPIDRARFLFHLRLLPLVASVAWATLASGSFVLFEPRSGDEHIGQTLPVLAACGALLLLAAVIRLVTTIVRHHQMLSNWRRGATSITLAGVTTPAFAINSDFPVVAVVGVLRPRLMVAQCVLDTCTAEELAAILAHEQMHITRRDNLRRLLLMALPDPFAWLSTGRAMDLAWHDAVEQVADEGAGDRAGDAGRVALAGALVRLARLVPESQPITELPASALYRGEPIEQRVRRLLDPIPPRPRAPRHYQWAALVVVLTLAIVLLNPIHELLEAAVTRLP